MANFHPPVYGGGKPHCDLPASLATHIPVIISEKRSQASIFVWQETSVFTGTQPKTFYNLDYFFFIHFSPPDISITLWRCKWILKLHFLNVIRACSVPWFCTQQLWSSFRVLRRRSWLSKEYILECSHLDLPFWSQWSCILSRHPI